MKGKKWEFQPFTPLCDSYVWLVVVKMGLHIVCSRVHVLWSSKRFIKGKLQWTSKYLQTTKLRATKEYGKKYNLDYLPYTGCCYQLLTYFNSLKIVSRELHYEREKY